jgi:8-oxo-dGTP diphosphatase
MRSKAAECVSGVLLMNGAVLVEKRRADDDADPGKVLLPGGHVESGESLQQALRREMKEELGIRVEKATSIRVRFYTDSKGERQRIHYFHVKAWTGEIVSNEAESVYWEPEIRKLSDSEERAIVARLLYRKR